MVEKVVNQIGKLCLGLAGGVPLRGAVAVADAPPSRSPGCGMRAGALTECLNGWQPPIATPGGGT